LGFKIHPGWLGLASTTARLATLWPLKQPFQDPFQDGYPETNSGQLKWDEKSGWKKNHLPSINLGLGRVSTNFSPSVDKRLKNWKKWLNIHGRWLVGPVFSHPFEKYWQNKTRMLGVAPSQKQ